MSLWAGPWLNQVTKMIAGVSRAVVVLAPSGEGRGTLAASWPPKMPCDYLIGPAELAMAKGRGIVRRRKPGPESDDEETGERDDVALPLMIDGAIAGAVAVDVPGGRDSPQRAVMQLLQWAASWIQVAKMAPERTEATSALDLVALALEAGAFRQAATDLVTELATRLGCERVSLGMRQGSKVQVRALSHSAEFSHRTQLIGSVRDAMDEAIDQRRSVVIPVPPGPARGTRVTRAHEQLARRERSDHICTVPLCAPGRVVGAITLERAGGRPFDAKTVELLELAGSLLGPILDLRLQEDRGIFAVLRDGLREQWRALSGPGHALYKCVVGGLVVLAGVMVLGRAEYRVRADARLEGLDQRALSAPLDGFIAESHARAGDMVKRGDLLAVLDDRELQLERVKWISTRDQRDKEYRAALAEHDAAGARILGAQLAQAEAQLALVEAQLVRRKLQAPFDGIVVEGDLSTRVGSPVQRGDVLFVVAPLEGYRVVLEVDEREIARVEREQRGQLSLSAMPGTSLPLRIQKITPVSTARDGRNFFRVEAELESSPGFLRPGLEGVAKVGVGRRSLFWVWTHEAFDWLRLWLWTWWP